MNHKKIFRAFGINVYLSPWWIFFVLLLVGMTMMSHGIVPALTLAAVLLCVYASVVIHEFAHSLVAMRQYGIAVPRIVLYPIGGAAQLARIPVGRPEFMIAVVGPICSAVIGVITLILAFGLFKLTGRTVAVSILATVSHVNFILAVFNLFPIFPLDGGRLFRSIFYGITKNLVLATKVAVYLGWLIGVLALAYFGIHVWLLIIFAFVILAGLAELQMVERGAR